MLGTILSVAAPLIAGALNKPKSPPQMQGQDPSTLPNIDIGVDFGTGPKVKKPLLPTLPNLPMNMPTLPTPKVWAPTQGEAGAMDATKAQGSLYGAMLDPNNPIYKNQVESQYGLIQNDFLRGLRDTVTANRREVSRGRRGFLNPERMDENVIGSVTQNSQKSRLQARQQALLQLDSIAKGVGGVAENYRGVANLETGRRTDYRQDMQNQLTQQRSDIATRLGLTRQDEATRNEQQRSDINDALNLYRQNLGTSNNAAYNNYAMQSDYGARTAGLVGAGANSFLEALKGINVQSPRPSSNFVGPMPQTSLFNYPIFGG